jgi:hypothetical protein
LFIGEIGALFGVVLAPHNRWAGFKAPREKWLAHVEATRSRPVLLIRSPSAPTLGPIATLHYFRPVLDELLVQPLEAGDVLAIESSMHGAREGVQPRTRTW